MGASDYCNLNKVVKVVKSDNIKTNKAKLPKSWSSLYLLAGLDDEQFNQVIGLDEFSPDIARSSLAKLVNNVKGTNSKTTSSKKKEGGLSTSEAQVGGSLVLDDKQILIRCTKNELTDTEIEFLRKNLSELDFEIELIGKEQVVDTLSVAP